MYYDFSKGKKVWIQIQRRTEGCALGGILAVSNDVEEWAQNKMGLGEQIGGAWTK